MVVGNLHLGQNKDVRQIIGGRSVELFSFGNGSIIAALLYVNLLLLPFKAFLQAVFFFETLIEFDGLSIIFELVLVQKSQLSGILLSIGVVVGQEQNLFKRLGGLAVFVGCLIGFGQEVIMMHIVFF